MPIYEYRCGACGHQQEFLQKVSDAPLTDCPKCGKPSLSKMVTAAGFQLKGSGWYATDFKNKGSTPAKAKESKDEGGKADSGKGDGGKGDKGDKGGSSGSDTPAACGAGACPACQ
jgi:putative FmdB family regulatory protein